MTFTFYTELALGADLSASPSTYSWTDVTAYVGGSEISITRGRADQYSEASPDRCSLEFLNNSGRFVPRNPEGPYYGQLSRNTPLRVLIRPNVNSLSDTFTRSAASSWGTADSGGAWTNVGTAADYSVASATGGRHTHPAAAVRHQSLQPLSIVRSDQLVRIKVNALSTVAAQTGGLTCRYVGAGDNRRGELQFAVGGAITVRAVARDAGVDTVVASQLTTLTHSTSSWYWLRMQVGLTSVRVKAWLDGTTEPTTWQLDAADSAAFSSPVAGTMGPQSIRETGNTNASATIDFDTYTMVDGPRIQFTGFVDEWPVTWGDQSLSQSYAPVTASGQLRRMARTPPLRSAIYRQLTSGYNTASPHVIGYWPMEDGTSATSFSSGIGGRAFTFTDMRPGSSTDVLGSEPLPVVGANGTIKFLVPSYAASTRWAIRFLFRMPASPSTSAQLLSWTTPGGTFMRWQLTLIPGTPDTMRLEGYNSAGTATFVDSSVSFIDVTSGVDLSDGRQLYFEVDGVQNGANIDLSWNVWYVPADRSSNALGLGSSASTAGTLANVALIYHDAVTGLSAGGHTLGHVAVGNSVLIGANAIGVTGGADAATDSRFGDVCDEQNVYPYFGDLVLGTGTTTQTMGPQRSSDALTQLREIEATELGVLFDGKQGFVHLLPRSMRQNHAVNLTLNVSSGQVGWPFVGTDDDFLLRNDVTVTSPSGSSARATADLATLQLQGVHTDQVQVNPYRDEDLWYQATWRKNAGQVDDLRYPAVVIDLTRNHVALADAWCDCDIGSRIQVTGVPGNELPPDSLDLILEGYTETISSTEWRVEANTSPAKAWNVIKLDDTVLAELEQSGSTLAAGYSPPATSFSVVCTGALWSTTAADFDVNIAGERITVTTVAGGASPQTFTVIRSVNGIVKAQASGATVKLWSTGVLGI